MFSSVQKQRSCQPPPLSPTGSRQDPLLMRNILITPLIKSTPKHITLVHPSLSHKRLICLMHSKMSFVRHVDSVDGAAFTMCKIHV